MHCSDPDAAACWPAAGADWRRWYYRSRSARRTAKLICPFFGDLPFWGRRVQALGAGPAPIPQKRLTAERLAAAIIAATSDPAITANAEALGRRLRAERGVESAVDWFEHWMSSRTAATA